MTQATVTALNPESAGASPTQPSDTATTEESAQTSTPFNPFFPFAMWFSLQRAASQTGNTIQQQAWEYGIDAMQRSILFWDTLRQRGNIFLEHQQQGKPPVLQFDYEMLIDGRTLERPVNYALVRILPGEGMVIDPGKRPFVIIDPRAGHGPGISGLKHDSEIGVALRASHPVYFVMFFPDPEPGQTIPDISRTEALFIEEVNRCHPAAPKPCVIGNCQAGWAVAMLAAVAPELMGPIILSGSPMSYWAGTEDKNPMRYSGGLLGGKWLTTLTSDLGNGKFDGAWLVNNFENLNPANTYWSKLYHLYANIDTEPQRFLDFERWWGGFFLMNAEEMDFIVSNLFIGNKLARGGIKLQDGTRIDLKNIRNPIVVFCSHGDNITPPQQALNWIVDVYGTDEAILKNGQTIVYTLHEDIGHLGIFVSGAVARKQHQELITTLDQIDILPPGLYEMIIEKKNPFVERAELIQGDYVVRFEMRRLQDIMALDDDWRDEDYFASVAAVSELNDRLYRNFWQPWVRRMTNEVSAEWRRRLQPNRLHYYLWSDLNPFLVPLKMLAEQVREHRQPVSRDNYFLSLERDLSRTMEDSLDAYRVLRDDGYRNLFKLLYGPLGLGAWFKGGPPGGVEPPRDDEAAFQAEIERLRGKMEVGGLAEAVARMVIATLLRVGIIDYRSRLIAQQLRQRYQELALSPEENKRMLREQFYLLHLDEDQAIQTLAKLLPTPEERRKAVAIAAEILMLSEAKLDPDAPLARKIAAALNLDLKQVLQGKGSGLVL